MNPFALVKLALFWGASPFYATLFLGPVPLGAAHLAEFANRFAANKLCQMRLACP